MTITKKISALLLAVITLFTSAAMAANAYDNSVRETVNAEIDEPTAGKKADFSMTLDNNSFKPGIQDVYLLDIYKNYEGAYKSNVKSAEDYIDYLSRNAKEPAMKYMIEEMSYDKKTVEKFYDIEDKRSDAIKEMQLNGVMWIEYDKSLFDGMVVPDGANPEKYKYEYLMFFYSYKEAVEAGIKEYIDLFGELLPKDTVKKIPFPRFLKSGDRIKKGKCYFCCLNAVRDQSEFINKINPLCKDLEPYYDKLFELEEKEEKATEAEKEKIEAEIDNLRKKYEKEINLYTQSIEDYKQNTKNLKPILTVNGKEMAESYDSDIWVSLHDYGEAKQSEEFDLIGALEEFFESIVDFFKKLFSFDFENLNMNLTF